MIRKFLSLTILFAMLFAFANTSVQAADTIAQISLGSYKSITSGIKTMGKMLDNPQLAVLPKLLEAQLGDDFAKSFDKKQPAGALIYKADNAKEGECPVKYLVFLPITNAKPILAKLEENDSIEIDKNFDCKGTKMVKLSNDENTIYAITANGWAFLSGDAEMLLDLPKEPASLLGDLPQKYILATKINVDAIPESAKKWVIEQIESGIKAAEDEDADDAEENEDDSVFGKIAKKSQESQLDGIKKLIYEFKTVVVGMALDSEKNSLYFDLEVTPVENSDIAKQIKSYENIKPFGNFILKDATVYSTQVSILEDSQAKQALEILPMLVEGLNKAIEDGDIEVKDKDKLNALIEKTSKVSEKLIKKNSGKIVKSGSAFFFKEDNLSIVTATEGANVEGVDALIQEWVKTYVNNADKYFKTNTETWKGLTFNVATIPTENITKELRKLLEEKLADDSDDVDDSTQGSSSEGKLEIDDEDYDTEDEGELEIDDEDYDTDDEEEIEIDPEELLNELCQTIEAVFGDKVEIAYAVGQDKFYFAAGKDAVELIKKVVENTDAVVPNGQQDVTVLNVAEFFATLSKLTFLPEEARDIADAVASAAAGDDDQGKIYLGAKSNGNGGVIYRLEAEAGILRAIQTAIMLFSMGI